MAWELEGLGEVKESSSLSPFTLTAGDDDVGGGGGPSPWQRQIAIGEWLELVAAPEGISFGLEPIGNVRIIIVVVRDVEAQRGAVTAGSSSADFWMTNSI